MIGFGGFRDMRLDFPCFEWICFHHVIRELNVKEDELYKEAFQLQRGEFVYYDYFDGVEIEAMKFPI